MGRSGVRSEWSDVPVHIRTEVDRIAGSRVVEARNIDGGFSPGPAARCDLDDGRVVFVKAAGSDPNPFTPTLHRREARILAALPAEVPAPRLIGVADDGDWIALVITWIEGAMPTSPLTAVESTRVIGLAERLAGLGSGIGIGVLEPVADTHAALSGHWKRLLDEPLDGLDRWTAEHLGDLARLDADFAAAVEGDHLLHVDLRTDNIVLGATAADDVIVDWPSACRGAPWVDLVGLLPSLHLDGGPEPAQAWRDSAIGATADAAAVDVCLASIAGYFTRMSLLPPPPGLPTVRQFQAAQGNVARAWLRQRLADR